MKYLYAQLRLFNKLFSSSTLLKICLIFFLSSINLITAKADSSRANITVSTACQLFLTIRSQPLRHIRQTRTEDFVAFQQLGLVEAISLEKHRELVEKAADLKLSYEESIRRQKLADRNKKLLEEFPDNSDLSRSYQGNIDQIKILKPSSDKFIEITNQLKTYRLINNVYYKITAEGEILFSQVLPFLSFFHTKSLQEVTEFINKLNRSTFAHDELLHDHHEDSTTATILTAALEKHGWNLVELLSTYRSIDSELNIKIRPTLLHAYLELRNQQPQATIADLIKIHSQILQTSLGKIMGINNIGYFTWLAVKNNLTPAQLENEYLSFIGAHSIFKNSLELFALSLQIPSTEKVVVDFSTVKKSIKEIIDHKETGFDHKLWVIEGWSKCEVIISDGVSDEGKKYRG
jgi:hypothetical protein